MATQVRRLRLLIGSALVCALAIVGCSGPQEGDGDASQPRVQQRAEPSGLNVPMASTVDLVKTVQLYADEEQQLPVVPLRGGRQLTLEFDLMEPSGRTLSVYFYHADRNWERDLFAGEYMTSFERDELFDYTASRNTQVRYTHYTYKFPNSNIGFRISGNYILRVTEQGREDEVLFERAFFVTEDAAALQFGIDNLIVGGGFPSSQPTLSFRPPQALAGNVFDYNVCFLRNGRLETARCSNDASLTQQPDLLFYLQPERAFPPASGDYFLDLRTIRVGGMVEATDRTVQPYRVALEPDYARFASSSIDPLLNGQTVISTVRDVGTPDLEGEYVEAVFRYVPDNEERLPGGVYLTGSFNDWSVDLGKELRWVPENKRYEGSLLLKQGQYEYRYTSPDRRVRRQLNTAMPRPENTYAAFVYFDDVSLNTDRLLAAQSIIAR